MRTFKLTDQVTVTVGPQQFPPDVKFVKVNTTEGLRVWATKYVKVSVWPKPLARKAVAALWADARAKYDLAVV